MIVKIRWLDWGKEAFKKAKEENKPILLDLTAVWCHWCHVMDATSYSNSEIIGIINNDFVPVKVDIDKRPDIRERYNMGGFPSTVFLDSDGEVIAGETYVPTERLKMVLKAVKDSYKQRKSEIQESRLSHAHEKKHAKREELTNDIIREVALFAEDNFDKFYGGFGTEPKFPSPEVIDLLFMQYQKTKDRKYLDMTLKTLDGMHKGIFDKIDFGFFRYSVTQDWKTPHYEKMLDTNAGLLRNYLDAYNVTKNEKYKKIAMETICYVDSSLSDRQNGGFYGSQDADEEFYLSSLEERKGKKQPYVDKTIYVDWNSMMISSFVKAGAILNNKNAVDFAVKTADFILKKCYSKEKGMFHFFDGNAHVNGLLSDNIYFLNSLIDIYSATKDGKYLEKATEIAEFIEKNFHDAKAGGFFDRLAKHEDFGALKVASKQFIENSFCAYAFLKLFSLTKEERHREMAENTLLYFSDSYLNYGYFSSLYATAIGILLENDS
ncbi:thioredoxin domain-containing protein [Candidatus Woesearchaeota archaeon]|nr:thioredoxin domain-containing protein [Candidatus Woesearchaeota archaeon]